MEEDQLGPSLSLSLCLNSLGPGPLTVRFRSILCIRNIVLLLHDKLRGLLLYCSLIERCQSTAG
jgi:hypothetical protein